jgi:outer membrane protein assembly factor BamB
MRVILASQRHIRSACAVKAVGGRVFEARWERHLCQAGWSDGVVVGDGVLVAHERHNRLVRLDPETGAVHWDVRVGTWPRSIVVAGQRCLVIPQDANRLLCLDLATGDLLWHNDLRPFTGGVALNGDEVHVGGWRGYSPIRSVDLATGHTLAEPVEPVPVAPDPDRLTLDLGHGDTVVAVVGTLRRLDASGQVVASRHVTHRIRSLLRLTPGLLLVIAKGSLLAVEAE